MKTSGFYPAIFRTSVIIAENPIPFIKLLHVLGNYFTSAGMFCRGNLLMDLSRRRKNCQRKFHNAKIIPILREPAIPIIVLRFETPEGEDIP